MEDNIKIAMVAAVSEALTYKKNNPLSNEGEIMRHVLYSFRANEQVKIGIIAAVSKALTYKENRTLSDKEIISKIMNEGNDILKGIRDSQGFN